MSATEIEPIFVVGAPRSGTTLLQLILNAHPDVAIHGEIHYFDAILQLVSEVPDLGGEQNLAKFFEQLRRANALKYIPGLEQRLEIVRARLAQDSSAGYESFFRTLMEVFAEESGAQRFGEKTPQNIRYLPELTRIFPRAKIVHIVRDPRDVVSSLTKMPWAPDSVVLNTLKWKIDMLYMHDFLEAGGDAHELRYEDLVADPRETLEALCRFIGVDWHSAMLEFNRSSDSNIQDEPWKLGTRKALNASAVSGWKEKLEPVQAAVVQFFSTPFLRHYAYEPAKVSFVTWLKMPWSISADLVRYVASRRATRGDETPDEAGLIVGEESRLKAKMAEAMFRRRI